MIRIFVTRNIPGPGIDMLKHKGYEVDVFPKDRPITSKELKKALKRKVYDGIVSLLTDSITKEIFDVAPSVRIVSNYAVGFNNIDVKEAAARGVAVTNTYGTSSESVAEHTIALILALMNRIVEGDVYMRKGKYTGWSPTLLWGEDFQGRTLGLIGAGKIGERVAKFAHEGFGARVIYHDICRNQNIEREHGAQYVETIEDVLKQSDVVSLHVPLLDSTYHLISAEHLHMMKPRAYLVNTSRGPVIDEIALVDALKKGIIAGAALDVFEFEPKLARGLTDLPNVVLTPHIASSREDTRCDMSRVAAENIVDFFEGRTPKGLVANKSSCQTPTPVSAQVKV